MTVCPRFSSRRDRQRWLTGLSSASRIRGGRPARRRSPDRRGGPAAASAACRAREHGTSSSSDCWIGLHQVRRDRPASREPASLGGRADDSISIGRPPVPRPSRHALGERRSRPCRASMASSSDERERLAARRPPGRAPPAPRRRRRPRRLASASRPAVSLRIRRLVGVVVDDQDAAGRAQARRGRPRSCRRRRPRSRSGAVKWKRAALAGLALDPDPAAHQLDQLRGDRQAQPVPPYCRVVEPSAWVNGSKIASLLLGRDADAGVADREVQARRRRRRRARPAVDARRRPRPARVNLIALPTRFDEHLPEPARVADQRVGHVRADVGRPARAPSACARSASGSTRVAERVAQVEVGSASRSQLARLDLREVEDVVDAASAATRPTYLTIVEVLALLGGRARCRARARSCRGCRSSGVRISWLMLARNSLLAWLAASAASLAWRSAAVWRETRRRSSPTHPNAASSTTTSAAASVSVRSAVHHDGPASTLRSDADRR